MVGHADRGARDVRAPSRPSPRPMEALGAFPNLVARRRPDAAGVGRQGRGRRRPRPRATSATRQSLNLFVVGDNLLKGAALNTVQIAELLHERGLVRPARGRGVLAAQAGTQSPRSASVRPRRTTSSHVRPAARPRRRARGRGRCRDAEDAPVALLGELAQARGLVDRVADRPCTRSARSAPTLPATAGPARDADRRRRASAQSRVPGARRSVARGGAARRPAASSRVDRRAEDAQRRVALELVHPAAVARRRRRRRRRRSR